jgi:hypothetical protein
MVRAETIRKNRRGWEDNNKMDHKETGSGYGSMAGSCEDGNNRPGYKGSGDFPD